MFLFLFQTSLRDYGRDSLQKEFRQMLNRHSKPVSIDTIVKLAAAGEGKTLYLIIIIITNKRPSVFSCSSQLKCQESHAGILCKRILLEMCAFFSLQILWKNQLSIYQVCNNLVGLCLPEGNRVPDSCGFRHWNLLILGLRTTWLPLLADYDSYAILSHVLHKCGHVKKFSCENDFY